MKLVLSCLWICDIIFFDNNLAICIKSHKIGLPHLLILHVEIHIKEIFSDMENLL